MNISRELWLHVEPLLAAGLEMDAIERAAWLARLDVTDPQGAPFVRRMLAAHERAERSREMETVPRLAASPAWTSAYAQGARIGPFELVRPLGRGGMGEVWLARQADGRVAREAALKLPTIHQQGGSWRERFRRERDILARLEHPHIARFYDAGVTDSGQPWLAMEFVEGLSLAEHVASRSLSIPERLALFRQVLSAVGHAHRYLVVHRDLKPGNVLIDARGQVKLLDFGIAKLLDEEDAAGPSGELTRIGGRVMTLRYAAPEQVAGGTITTATDVYALGVNLHELVTGLAPYRAVREGRTLTDAMLLQEDTTVPSKLALTADAARQCGLASPQQLARRVSGDLDAIVLKAMRRDPAQRYASVELIDEDILAHLERRPVKARAGTWRYLAGRFAARHKLPLATAAAVVVTLLAGLVMIDRERRVAVAERARAEKHFAAVRKLANTFVFEVHDEIEGLAGSLKAREMLIKTALQYLDELEKEAGNDPALAYDIAAAYRKIGEIQGQPGGANTGDLVASLANFQKGKRLFVALDATRPNDIAVVRDHMRLSYALARAYVLKADPRWQDEIAATVKLSERVAALPGATPRDRARAASTMAEQANLTSVMAGQSAAVEATVARAVANLEALARELPGDLGVRENLAATYERAASINAGDKHTPQSLRLAIAYLRTEGEVLRGIAAERPNEQRIHAMQLAYLVNLAQNLTTAGELAEAERTIGEALELAAVLLARDPRNAERTVDSLMASNSAAFIAYRLGDPPRTIRRAREALAFAARLPEATRGTRDVRNIIAEAKFYLGGGLLASSSAPSLDVGQRRALLLESRSLLAEAAAFLDEVRREKLGHFNESESRELDDTLKRCEEALARLRPA